MHIDSMWFQKYYPEEFKKCAMITDDDDTQSDASLESTQVARTIPHSQMRSTNGVVGGCGGWCQHSGGWN